MRSPRPLFIIGSKRSGTTFLVNALNLNAQVFISHESDIIWILYQIYKDVPDRFQVYPLDDGTGMRATLNHCGEILKTIPSGIPYKKIIVRMFYNVLMHINEYGRRDALGYWDKPLQKKDLAWIGDKNPVQLCDPEIQLFLNDLFPEAHYIHMIRNPRFVIASMIEASKTWNKESVPDYWKGTPQQILERWAIHEEWVLQIKSNLPNRVHTIRLEDLAEDPVRVLSGTFGFLGLDLPPDTEELYSAWVWKKPNQRHQSFDLPISDRAYRIMEIYGYAD